MYDQTWLNLEPEISKELSAWQYKNKKKTQNTGIFTYCRAINFKKSREKDLHKVTKLKLNQSSGQKLPAYKRIT